jgi:hypothetical protein
LSRCRWHTPLADPRLLALALVLTVAAIAGKVVAGLAAGKRQGEVTLNIHTVERETRGGFTLSGDMTARLVPASGTGAPVVMKIAF